MTLWLATTNTHKTKEIKSFFKNTPTLRFLDLSDINCKNYIPPEETGSTFKENAGIKSAGLLKFLKDSNLSLPKPLWIVGEDSGLEVKVLKGKPGIYSARYSGPQATDQKNNQLLLKNLLGKTDRIARYVCVFSCQPLTENSQELSSSETKEFIFEGFCHGSITVEEKGVNGFGYDPLFIPQGETKTFGELSHQFKESISHRIQALKKLADTLKVEGK
ncbi:MAG: RdgB/HAM1 family non-canonical purine NTP pyrophosphatase [Bdellovibrionales bacterium]|nr:RdgB/HAM1 family non-canonical purine NTP pyrophosphatase [Bdellovibrionales bacterium]